jgi:hypothetical protein
MKQYPSLQDLLRSYFPHTRKARLKLSSAGPVVLYAKVCGRVGRRRIKSKRPRSVMSVAFLLVAREDFHHELPSQNSILFVSWG